MGYYVVMIQYADGGCEAIVNDYPPTPIDTIISEAGDAYFSEDRAVRYIHFISESGVKDVTANILALAIERHHE
jgi:hypothetical protein